MPNVLPNNAATIEPNLDPSDWGVVRKLANRMTDDGRARYEALDRPHKASILSEQRLVAILTAMKNHKKS